MYYRKNDKPVENFGFPSLKPIENNKPNWLLILIIVVVLLLVGWLVFSMMSKKNNNRKVQSFGFRFY